MTLIISRFFLHTESVLHVYVNQRKQGGHYTSIKKFS